VLARGAFDGRDHALIRPGDYVDVLMTLDDGDGRRGDRRGSRVLLQRVLLLAVGGQTLAGIEARQNTGSNPLTLSLEIQQAQKLSLAIERGSISVVLRNPEDALIVEHPPRVGAAMLSDGLAIELPAPSAQPVNLGDIR
jgi:pilus assembly protein CpaB